MKITTLLSKKSDNVGIISSVLCLIHCLLLPIAISAMSVVNHAHDHAHHHHHDHGHGSLEALDYVFWVFSLIAVYYSMRQTTLNKVRLAFVLAGLLFTCGILFKEILPFGHAWSYAGSVCLILTHYYNMRYCSHCANIHAK
jgi:hypothetical protein